LGLAPIGYREPGRTRVQPPAVNDGQQGWIASRSLDVHGRPVAWVFTGAPPEPDGSQVFVDDALAVTSTNHAELVAGAAYPLLYDTLFASLRQVLADAAVTARQRNDGLWASNRTLTGVDGSTVAALEEGGLSSRSCSGAWWSSTATQAATSQISITGWRQTSPSRSSISTTTPTSPTSTTSSRSPETRYG
ncbi:MAG: hypothetical protein M3513_16540, partial [Actinomycetota bacterium]|nr:hypothetical protein [Actinomycetota bacterium]